MGTYFYLQILLLSQAAVGGDDTSAPPLIVEGYDQSPYKMFGNYTFMRINVDDHIVPFQGNSDHYHALVKSKIILYQFVNPVVKLYRFDVEVLNKTYPIPNTLTARIQR